MRDNFKDKGEPVGPDMEAWGLPSTTVMPRFGL